MNIQKIGAVAANHGVKAVLYGASGTGKTYSIASVPNHAGVIVLSAEAGLLSIRSTAADVDAAIITSLDDMRESFAFLSGEGGAKYHTVILDSLTEIAQQVLSFELEKNKDGRKAYGEMNETMTRLIKGFRDLPGKNVILICQQARVQDDNGRVFHAAAMPGKQLSQWLPYATDLVACLRLFKGDDGVTRRAFQFRAHDEQYDVKDRSGALDEFEPPDWSVIFGKINAAITAKKGGK